MSVYGVNRFIFELKRDKALQATFRTAPDSALAAFPLEPAERDALKSGDLAYLYQQGVHPLLLAPYSRAMGISRPQYQAALAPFRGVRMMRSA